MIDSMVQYVLLALGLIGSLTLFLTVKREMQSNAARHRRSMEKLARRMEEPPPPGEPVLIPPAARSGLNIGKRVQAMRMLRRNEDVSHIAAALGVTRREVELLIRVQKLSAGAVTRAAN
jgi:hypothetical protein